MTLSFPRTRYYLQQFDLEQLFIEELGWDHHSGQLAIQLDGYEYKLRAFAEKRGVQIFDCQPDVEGDIPDYATRRKIEKQVTKSAYEHLIIYIDAERTRQIWQWVSRQPGRPAAYREHHYHPDHHAGDSLISKLESITFPLSEEEGLTLTGVVFRLRDAFDRDKVTKRFYDLFKKEHGAFLNFVEGITEQGDKEWYASLMLNRLMFVYFIQRKGFLDGDTEYLKNRLKIVQQKKGKGKFLTFYRYFLLRLFHEGFSQQPPQRAPDLEELLGSVPYLDGGLFELHELEEKHPDINISDDAFERLFGFFDQYEWHLDTRPLRNDREINPDVLGYIFEKYINQKQMGAYYTKEDITEYISKSTIVPYLFKVAEKECAIAFQPDSALWGLIREDPDRYIYPAVRKGIIDEIGEVIPLPEEIAKGIKDVSQRVGWNRPADPEYALPTETWREHVARRKRCFEAREKLLEGEILRINDFITHNLDLRQFAEDVIAACEGPELLRAFYHAVSTVTILDPACGSGAFLFAALNILEPLYEACLDRMQAFVDDLDTSGEHHRPEKFVDFRRILAEIDRHPNRCYFVLKSIIINNLYGVDIMEEAVEICKLRLFLKLMAQVDRVRDLEPLPDIDFNIRAGNTLVGFVSVDEIRLAAKLESTGQGKLVFGETEKAIQSIKEEADVVDRAFRKFHEMQIDHDMDAREFTSAKRELSKRLRKLADDLDSYLARDFGIDQRKTNEYIQWRKSHQPFHWFSEFYGIMSSGGFNVVIGNPPYVETRNVTEYSVRNFLTEPCRDLYALVLERSTSLADSNGGMGFIVPLSCFTVNRFAPLQTLFLKSIRDLFISHWSGDAHPSKLFEGVDKRLEIIIGHKSVRGPNKPRIYTSRYLKWYADERPNLFQLYPVYCKIEDLNKELFFPNSIVKIGTSIERDIVKKLKKCKRNVGALTNARGSHKVYYTRKVSFFLQFLDFIPEVEDEEGRLREPSELKVLYFDEKKEQTHALASLSSALFYWFNIVNSDCRNLNKREIVAFPVANLPSNNMYGNLQSALMRLMKTYQENSDRRTVYYKNQGNITVQYFNFRPAKPIIDEIDIVLAKHYGFSEEELDFIINYDIKYRMGRDFLDHME